MESTIFAVIVLGNIRLMGFLVAYSVWVRRRRWYQLVLAAGWAIYALATLARLPMVAWPSLPHVLGMASAVVGLLLILVGAMQYFVTWDPRRTVVRLVTLSAAVGAAFIALALSAGMAGQAGILTLSLQTVLLLFGIGLGVRHRRRLARETPNALIWFWFVAVFGVSSTAAYMPLVQAGLGLAAVGLTVLTSVSGVFLMAMLEGDTVLRELRESEEDLRAHRANLERSVEERTAQLADAVAGLQEANQALVKAQGSKDRLLAAVSHELRTPLNSIIGFSGVMLQGLAGELEDEQRTQLEMISSSGKHLLNLVNDLLDYERLVAGRAETALEEFDVCESARGVCAKMKPVAESKNIAVVEDIPAECMILISDKRLFEQILWNLLGNAVKFTDEGNVALRVEKPTDGRITVAVTDTGIGIEPERLARVFDEFVGFGDPANGRSKGSGLGLALSLETAKLLGGGISATSVVGGGSVFTLTLPVEYPN